METNDLQTLIRRAETGSSEKIDAKTLRDVISAAGVQGLMAVRVEVSEEKFDLLLPRVDLLLYDLSAEPEIRAASPPERIKLACQAVQDMLELAARESATFQFELWLDLAADDVP